ncbi:hypothetical protein Tco_0513777 [Tanacetum coccineum]
MHQPWRTFAASINWCISGKSTGLDKLRALRVQILWVIYHKLDVDFVALLWEDFMFQADNRDISPYHKEHMPYPRFTKRIISYFISKDKTISMRNRINLYTIHDDSLLGTLKYKTVPIASKEPTKKRAKKAETVKKSSRKIVGVLIRDTLDVPTPKQKAPSKKTRGKGLYVLSKVALTEEEQLKEVLLRSKKDTHISHPSGSERVLEDSGDEEENDDDDNDDDSENVEQDDEHVRTLEKNECSDNEQENVDEEETYEELYGDVNVNLEGVVDEEEGIRDEEMIDASQKDAT